MNSLADRVERMLSGPRPLPLVFAGDPVLRIPASAYDYSLPDDLWSELVEAMFQTMRAAPGVGLAAPQIGLGIRVAVLEDAAELPPELAAARQRYPTARRVLVNPRYDDDLHDDRQDGNGQDDEDSAPRHVNSSFDNDPRGAKNIQDGNSQHSEPAVPEPRLPAAAWERPSSTKAASPSPATRPWSGGRRRSGCGVRTSRETPSTNRSPAGQPASSPTKPTTWTGSCIWIAP